jgi:protein ImuB
VHARLGAAATLQPVPVASHLPERAVALAPFAAASARRQPAPPLLAERPIRLLRHPEPVEVAAEVPEGPPLYFRWRRALHRIARAEGPERIEPEWWREPEGARARDYFQVEDESGRRFWLYRQGLYGDAGGPPRWFMHGMFA